KNTAPSSSRAQSREFKMRRNRCSKSPRSLYVLTSRCSISHLPILSSPLQVEGGGMVVEEFKVNPKFHSSIIGPDGVHIRSLMDRHNIMITVPQRDENSDIITLRGMKNAVARARAEIQEFIDYEVCQPTEPDS